MSNVKKLLSVACFVVCLLPVSHAQSKKWITVYFPTWAYGTLGQNAWSIPPWEFKWQGITHVVNFYGKGNVDSTISPYFIYITNPNDSIDFEFNGISNPGSGPSSWKHYQDSLITIAHRNGTKVLLSINAVDAAGLNFVAADSVRMDVFANAVVGYCERKHYDGVEVDWEGWIHPIGPVSNISRLIRRFRSRLNSSGTVRLLTFSPGSGHWTRYDPSLDPLIDHFFLQMYDFASAWGGPVGSNISFYVAPLHQGTVPPSSEIQGWDTRGPLQWQSYGHDISKISVGTPTFGYVIKNLDTLFQPVVSSGDLGYGYQSDCTKLLNNGGVAGWDDIRKVPYVRGTAFQTQGNTSWGKPGVTAGQKFFVTYENAESIQEKAKWVNENNMGGMMFYDVTMDLDPTKPFGQRNPIIQAGVSAFEGGTTPALPTGSMTATPSSLPAGGGSVTLTWTSTSALSASIGQGIGSVALSGSTAVNVAVSKTYTLTLTNAAGTTTYATAVTIAAPTAQQVPIYTDNGFTSPWTTQGSTNGTVDTVNKEKVFDGSTSLKCSFNGWGELRLRNGGYWTATPVDPAKVDSIKFAIYGGTTGVALQMKLESGSTALPQKLVFTAPANVWTVKSFPVRQLDSAGTQFTTVLLFVYQSAATVFYLDDIALTTRVLTPPAPTLLAPANGTTALPISVQASWSASPGAMKYHYQLATNSAFATLFANDSSLADTSRQIGPLSNGTTYFQRIRAGNAAGWSNFSSATSFTTIIAVPSVPQIAVPALSAINQPLSLTMKWNRTVGASRYQVQLSVAPTFAARVVDDSTLVDTLRQIGPLANATTYYLRVRAGNAGGWSAFSSTSSFSTLPPLPPSPTIVVPAPGSFNIPVLASLAWTRPSGVDSFEVQLADDSTFAATTNTDSLMTDTLCHIGPLSFDCGYFVRIRARNVAGWGAYSGTTSFSTACYVKTQAHFSFKKNTGNNATVAIPQLTNPTIQGLPIKQGDEIAVFTAAGLCVGAAEWNGSSTSLTVWGDDEQTPQVEGARPGEIYQYRMWRSEKNLEYSNVFVAYSTGSGVYAANALCVLSSLQTASVNPSSQTIIVSNGWNMVSSYCQPSDPTIGHVLSSIDSNLVIIKNVRGQVYWPSVGVDNIVEWNSEEGYQIYVRASASFSITGALLNPETTPLALSEGWNLAPYLRTSALDVQSAFASIASDLVIVKNNDGQVYWPAYGINAITSLNPGEAYFVYTNQNCTLRYPANSAGISASARSIKGSLSRNTATDSVSHFRCTVSRTGMSGVYLVEGSSLHNGDEIAAKCADGTIVGVAPVVDAKAIVTVWGKNAIDGQNASGVSENGKLNLVQWNMQLQSENTLEVASITNVISHSSENGDLKYQTNAILRVSVHSGSDAPHTLALLQNYPNPFNPSTRIEFSLPASEHVTLRIFNILGAEVATLLAKDLGAGEHSVEWNASGFASGVYFCRLQAGEKSFIRKLTLMK